MVIRSGFMVVFVRFGVWGGVVLSSVLGCWGRLFADCVLVAY